MADNLIPCPFCNGEASIGITDDEGNLKDESYLDDPFSGICYTLLHFEELNNECPIAHYYDRQLGTLYFKTKQEAIDAWSTRKYKENNNEA